MGFFFPSFTGQKVCADNQPTAMYVGYSHNLHMVFLSVALMKDLCALL